MKRERVFVCGRLSDPLLVLGLIMSDPPTVMEVDWCHCDGTKIHATIKIQHCYNLKQDLAPTFDSFCVSLRTLLVPQDPPGFTPRRTPD
jgi:hypothetical protein